MEFHDRNSGAKWAGDVLERDRRGRVRMRFRPLGPQVETSRPGFYPMRPFTVTLGPRAQSYRGWFRRAVRLASDMWVDPDLPAPPCDCRQSACGVCRATVMR